MNPEIQEHNNSKYDTIISKCLKIMILNVF